MRKKILIFMGLTLSYFANHPPLTASAWTEDLMKANCVSFIGNPATEANKVYVATVTGEQSTYYRMKFNAECPKGDGQDAIDKGYNNFTRETYGPLIIHRPALDKIKDIKGNRNTAKRQVAYFRIKHNTIACTYTSAGEPTGKWCEEGKNFWHDGLNDGKEYRHLGYSNTGTGIENASFPVDSPCKTSDYNDCLPKGYPWRKYAWDSGNIEKSDYDLATSGSTKYKIKYETIKRFLKQEDMGSDVDHYFTRFSLRNNGEMEAGVLEGSSGEDYYNLVVAAAPKTATRNIQVTGVAVSGNPSYVKGGSTQTVNVTIKNSGDIAVNKKHSVKVSYTDKDGNAKSATASWEGSIGAGNSKTIGVSIALPSVTQTLTLKGESTTSYGSYNQWTSDDSKTGTVKIDGTKPTGGITADTAWKNTNVEATLSSGDGDSGVSKAVYSLSGATSRGETSYTNGTKITISAEGETKITIKVTDKVGNTHTTNKTVKIDKTKPTCSISGSTSWQTANMSITLRATDALSGVETATYSLSGATSKGSTSYSDNASITISAEGQTKISTSVKDKAGNTCTANKTVSIDKTNPTGGIEANTAWQNVTSVSATLSAGDAISGVSNATYSLSGATSKGETSYTNGTKITISAEGETKITIKVTDVAGRTYTTNKTVKIDRTNPTGGITVNTTNWQDVESVDVTMNRSDAHSGIASAQYRFTGATTKDWASFSDGRVVTISNQGETTVEIKVTDKVGRTYTTTKVVRIDRTTPTGSISFNHENWQNASSITVKLNAGDSLSGVKTSQYKLSGATTRDWTNYSNGNTITISNEGATKVEIKVVDQVGRTVTSNKTVRIDRTKPTLTTSQNPASFTNADEVTITAKATDNLALWNLNAYRDTIQKTRALSSSYTKGTGKVLVVVEDSALNYEASTALYNDTLGNLRSLGFTVSTLKESEFTSESQYSGYHTIVYLGSTFQLTNRSATLINTAYSNGINIITTGNYTTDNLDLIGSYSATSGTYKFIRTTTTNYLAEALHNTSSTRDYYTIVQPAWSDTKVLTNMSHSSGASNSPALLHHTNAKSAQWIHVQGMSGNITDEFFTSAILLVTQRQATLTTSLTHSFTVTENGTYPVTVYDLAGNRATVNHVVNTIDRHNPTGSVVIDQGQDFLNNEETMLHIKFNDAVSGNNVASGVHTVKVCDVNGTQCKTFTNPTSSSLSFPWVLTPWEADDGALKAQVKVEITDKAGNKITVHSQVVDIIKVYVTDFYLTDVLNPLVYNENNPFQQLTYPYIPSQELLAGGNFSFEFDYYHPKNVNSKWKIDYILNIRYQKPNQAEEVLTTKRLKQQVEGHFETQHIIPYYMPEGTKVYLDIELVLYDQNGRKVATGYFPQPANTSLLIGEIKGDLRDVLQFNEFN